VTPSTKPAEKLSEAEFLRREAERSKKAAAQALNNARAVLVGKVDPRTITRKHPVIAILSAITGGFVAAVLAIPSREEQELRRMRRVHEAMNPTLPQAEGNGAAAPPRSTAKPTIWATVVHELIAMIKPILLATITAGIKSAHTAPPPPPPPAENADPAKPA
jgi:hypothetical protein